MRPCAARIRLFRLINDNTRNEALCDTPPPPSQLRCVSFIPPKICPGIKIGPLAIAKKILLLPRI
jgi:hypothetical protein